MPATENHMRGNLLSPNPDNRSRLRAYLIQLILVGAALLVSLGLVELALRSFPSLIGMRVLSAMDPSLRAKIAERLGLPTRRTMIRVSSKMRSDHGPTFVMPRPNSSLQQYNEKEDIAAGAAEVVHVDQNGFCNPPAKAARGKADILVAGDSFAFCTSLDPADTATAMLEEMSGLATYSVAIGGVGPDVYLELLKKFAPQFRPRIAVMNIYEGNDLRDILVKRNVLRTGKDSRSGRRQAGLFAWSYCAEFLLANARLAIGRVEHPISGSDNTNFRYAATVNGKNVVMNLSNKDRDEVKHALAIRNKEISFDEFRESLADFVKWSKANDIVPIVTYIPSMYTAYERSVRFEDTEVGSVVQTFSSAQRKWFANEAATIGFHYVDMTPSFQGAAAQDILTHFPGNVHLTKAGHEIVARKTLEMIRQFVSLR